MRAFGIRSATIVVLIAIASAASLACGDEDAQTLTFTLTEQGRGSTISGPGNAEAGLAEITLRNDGGKREGDLQLIRVEGERSADEVIEGLGAAIKGEAFPDWFFAGGGVGAIPAGQSRTVTQVLEPGTYYAVDTEGDGPPDPESLATLEVSGEESGDEVDGDATVSAFEYGFEADGLSAGETEVVFDNSRGAQPHHVIASKLVGDSTAEDVERFFKTERGKPPLSEKGTQATAVIEGGESQLVTWNLQPGRYALYCFITDRQGGPPHALKGMVDEVEVE